MGIVLVCKREASPRPSPKEREYEKKASTQVFPKERG
jgi:hypothetical protein